MEQYSDSAIRADFVAYDGEIDDGGKRLSAGEQMLTDATGSRVFEKIVEVSKGQGVCWLSNPMCKCLSVRGYGYMRMCCVVVP